MVTAPSPRRNAPPSCASSPPVSPMLWGTRARTCVCPYPPPARLYRSRTDSLQHLQRCSFAGTSLVSPCPLLKTPRGAVCRCLVLAEPWTWPDPPLASQRRWDAEVSALVLLLSCAAVKASAPSCSVIWRAVFRISFFNCPMKCRSHRCL